jgi:hypothetical protein
MAVACTQQGTSLTPPASTANATPTIEMRLPPSSPPTIARTPTPTPAPTATAAPLRPADPPQFSLAPGVYVGPQAVMLSGDAGVSFRYTLDGTDPTSEHGVLYTGPVTVTGRLTTLRAVAFGEGWVESGVSEATYKVFSKKVESADPIALEGDEVLEIVDTYFVHENDIVLRDNARLVIRGSLIEHRHQYTNQYGLAGYGHSQVVFEDSELQTSCTGSLNWDFFEDSSLTARGVHMPGCNTWSLFTERARATIEDWDGFGGTVCGQADVAIHDSQDMEVELCYPEGSTVDEELPLEVEEFTFPNENDSGVMSKLRITDSSLHGWGIGINPGTQATFRNSPAATVSVVIGYPWVGETVTLDGLDKTLYADKTWEIADATLRLVNSRTYGWEANVWGGNTLIVRNSNFTGATINGGRSFETIENSTLALVRGQEQVEITVRDSTVRGDVIATDDARVTLIDCVVENVGDQTGDVIASGNGVVTLVRTTVQGETRTEGNGRVVVQEGA